MVNCQKDNWDNEYNKSRLRGPVIAGTVYQQYPGNYPGLGWLP
jgi:hypothetical protein